MANQDIHRAASLIRRSKHAVAFTGAGISVESGIPPFRGPGGLWERYDPTFIELNYFREHPRESWDLIKKIFFDFIAAAEPNPAHYALAKLEERNYLRCVITQNIDGLHQKAGSRKVLEFHGNTRRLICLECRRTVTREAADLTVLPPACGRCGGVLKPDFVFFSEGIPEDVSEDSFYEANRSDVMLVIGTTGEVMPAGLLPRAAKDRGASVIEINPGHSAYSKGVTDILLKGKASEVLTELIRLVLEK